MNEIAIQHPILYESYNICQMALTSKLSNFSIAMLQDICKQGKTLHRPFAGIGEIMYLSDLAISLFLSSRSNHRFPFQITYVVRPLRDPTALNYHSRHTSVSPEVLQLMQKFEQYQFAMITYFITYLFLYQGDNTVT